jgi:signal transduction histidine kinase
VELLASIYCEHSNSFRLQKVVHPETQLCWLERTLMETEAFRTCRILCLEDNPHDHELLESTLSTAGLHCDFVLTKTKSEFESELNQSTYDLIISDFSLPSYDGMAALATAHKTRPETPFVFLSGTIGEGRAVQSLDSGATDYVLKDRPERLVVAVKRALREGRERLARKQLEEQLRQSQKLETIGRLTEGVAHDINNLLTVIQGNAELMLMFDSDHVSRSQECLNHIMSASDRAAGLTRQLLAMGRQHPLNFQMANLGDVASDLMRMLKRIIGENISLECNCTDDDAQVQVDVGMIEQVLLNLVVNARDAMPDGGRLSIATRWIELLADHTQLHPEAREGKFVRLSVTDTGTGIHPEHLHKIFEPFYTTKAAGKGTGLGLATVVDIVRQHSGWIDVSTRVGAGTTFAVYLPVVSNSNDSPASSASVGLCAGLEAELEFTGVPNQSGC